MNILIIAIGVILCLIGLLFIALAVFVVNVIYKAEKLMFGLPWLKWLTLDDVVAMGYSRFWCKMILPAFHKNGCLEVRIQEIDIENMPERIQEAFRDNPPEIQKLLTEMEIPFEYQTVALHDFRLTKRGGRRKKIKLSPKDLFATWQPVPA